MSSIAFKPEEARDALKEYTGQIVEIQYEIEPFGFKGDPSIKRSDKVLGLKLQTDAYEKAQYEWYGGGTCVLSPQSAFKSQEDKVALLY